jgi:type I restriction-modification system DNA methylase subunit
MNREYGTLLSLTSDTLSKPRLLRALEDFAHSFGWVPSDTLENSNLQEVANGHLIVEHGLETSAVITFLKKPFRDLSSSERKRLFSLSYNNLIDWHIQVDSNNVNFIYNRNETPITVKKYDLDKEQYDYLRSNAFEKITEQRPTTNLPALDDALIRTISNWKRLLSAEMEFIIPNKNLSALFNAIIFARAVEDQYRFRNIGVSNEDREFYTLMNVWRDGEISTVRELISNIINYFIPSVPEFIIDNDGLSLFDKLNKHTVFALLSDFYRNKYISYYDYDFSIISKHALSRIYEGYVSVLRLQESAQGSLFPEIPNEERDRAFGSVYTPQYIAKFFSRFIKQSLPISQFKKIKVCDPACGSGIFIRTILEMQAEPTDRQFDIDSIRDTFRYALGVDVDPNATHATELSLALLHLVLTDSLPPALNVKAEEAIQFFSNNIELNGSYDAVLANPPYVAVEGQSTAMQQIISEYLGDLAKGRVDMYIPFIVIAMDLLKPGGYGCFVLPHSFMLAKAAIPIRKMISDSADIMCIADLSAIPVFGTVGVYVVLVIFRKRSEVQTIAPSATIVKCQEFPGQALQDALDDRIGSNQFYTVYKVTQDIFRSSEWVILPPAEEQMRQKFSLLPKLKEFLDIKQGIVTGNDEVFIRRADQIPVGEKAIYAPLLRDRDMLPFITPKSSDYYVFYPFVKNIKLTSEELNIKFPKTWKYLEANRAKLEQRKSLEKYNKHWWGPMWPRSPEKLLVPKIISPHLMLVPRFSC